MRRREMLQQGRLPAEYQEVEWIGNENDGNNWIDTGVIMTDYFHFETKVDLTQYGKPRGYYSGAAIAKSGYIYNGLYQYGGEYNYSGITYGGLSESTVVQKISNGNLELYVDGVLKSTKAVGTIYGSDASTSYRLFSCYGRVPSSAIFYYFKIMNGQDDTPTMNLIPCYRKSDNEIGMYDLVGKTFYTNAGSGTFTKGADVL